VLSNYLLIAWRHLLKNKLYSTINVAGLVVGLSVYLFGSLLADYENSHDAFFSKSDRIFTVSSVFSSQANVGISALDAVHDAVGPIVESELEEVVAVARTTKREYLLTIDDKDFYQAIIFADPAILTIFDYDFIEGDETALQDRSALTMGHGSA